VGNSLNLIWLQKRACVFLFKKYFVRYVQCVIVARTATMLSRNCRVSVMRFCILVKVLSLI